MPNELIKKFDQLYVGFQLRRERLDDSTDTIDYILGFAAPYEKNAAGAKRQATVDGWAHSHPMDKDVNGKGEVRTYKYDPSTRQHISVTEPMPEGFERAKLVDNIPMEGFRVADDVKRVYWGGGNVVWRIDDPRGYQLEISSSNLARIIDAVGINAGGEIPGKCVWCRIGASNILVPESSPTWQQMLRDQVKLNEKKQLVTTTKADIGDLVDSKIGRAVFLGKVYVAVHHYTNAKERRKNYQIPERYELKVVGPYYALRVLAEKEENVVGANVTLYKDTPILSVIEAGKFDVERAKSFRDCSAIHFAGSNDYTALMLTDNKDAKIEIVETPIDSSTIGVTHEFRLTSNPKFFWDPSSTQPKRYDYDSYEAYRICIDEGSTYGSYLQLATATPEDSRYFNNQYAMPNRYRTASPTPAPKTNRLFPALAVKPMHRRTKDTLTEIRMEYRAYYHNDDRLHAHYMTNMTPAEVAEFNKQVRAAIDGTKLIQVKVHVDGVAVPYNRM